MHWQFGGNLEPVQMICEIDWKECPKAIANYVWREIVTDVLDCLRNESIIWQVLSVFFVCSILLRVIYSKRKANNNAAIDKDILLNKVGYKVEDLELKVNILTYKLQYGTWPLPHQIQKSNFRKNLRNLRLTLSNPSDRNNWIKHVLLSPRKNESSVSYSKYYPSEHQLTELFDAKTKNIHPYLRQENLPLQSSSKSSKSSSDRSLRLSSLFKNVMGRHKNFEMEYRNAISLPFFSRRKMKRNGRSVRKMRRDLKRESTVTHSCEKFTRTMDDCKKYLRQLHDSNKNLGLVCSSSETSNDSSVKNIWSDTQQQKRSSSVSQGDLIDLTCENPEETKVNDSEKAKNEKTEKNTERKDKNGRQNGEEQCLELTNTIYPVLQLIDKRLLPPKMNKKFCTEFPQQTTSNILVPASYERTKFEKMETSEEALHQVKKKLESLHNVLRMYELSKQNIPANPLLLGEQEKQAGNEKITVCQNLMETLVSVAVEDDEWTRNRIKAELSENLNGETRNELTELQKTISNSSEQYESDETGRSSIVSVQAYSNMFNKYCTNNIKDPYYVLMEKPESNNRQLEMIDNRVIYSSSVKYEKIPERIYYSISSDSFEKGKASTAKATSQNFAMVPALYEKFEGRGKSFGLSEQFPVPMETEEDTMMSPTSSRTEISKDSELDEKSTAVLLEEALQFKKALLTRVELEKVCLEGQKVGTNIVDYNKNYSCINNNVQTKFLDIISEEQSICSSTEKTSRTYMFFNLKQDKQLVNGNNFSQNEIIRDLSVQQHKKCFLDSQENLGSPSEYFSFSNIDEEGRGSSNLSFSRLNQLQRCEFIGEATSNLQVKYLNDALKESDEKLMKFGSCINSRETNLNEEEARRKNLNYAGYENYDNYNCRQKEEEEERFNEHFARISHVNEFMNRTVNSVELFSQDLDEAPAEDKYEYSNYENSKYADSSYTNSKNFLMQHVDAACNKKDAEGSNSDIAKLGDKQHVEYKIEEVDSDSDKYAEENKYDEICTCSPNLTLKRNPGAYSLIDQTLLKAISLERSEQILIASDTMNRLIEDPIYELSASDSKETSLEANFIQDSSSLNQSNDSNIPESPSLAVLINKSTRQVDEQKSKFDWPSSNFSDNAIDLNKKNVKTCSTNTITLEKYDTGNDTTMQKIMESYTKETESVYNRKNDKVEGGKEEKDKGTDAESPYANLGKEELMNEVEFYDKSYSNLASQHSSVYFTDEASSSAMKLNNTHSGSKNLKDLHYINLCKTQSDKENRLRWKEENLRGTENTEESLCRSSEGRKIDTVDAINAKCSVNAKENASIEVMKKMQQDKNDKTNKYDKEAKADLAVSGETKIQKGENKMLSGKISTLLCKENSIGVLDNLPEELNISLEEKNLGKRNISPNLTPRQKTPREVKNKIKENRAKKKTNATMKQVNTTEKSESHENYSPRSDRSKRLTHQNPKSLQSDVLNCTSRIRSENNTNSIYTKLRDSSAESRRNTEDSLKLDKKRSRSEISFRTNESFKEFECNANSNHMSSELSQSGFRLGPHLKSLSPTPKTSSRSCIPILKSRLEAARKSENESRPKSPVRGPLTITMCWSDNLCDKNQAGSDEIQVEGKNNSQEFATNYKEQTGNAGKHKLDSIQLQNIQNVNENITFQEQMVIYVNIFTKYDHNATKIVDPNKFLEYIKNRKANAEKLNEKQSEGIKESCSDRNAMHKIVTVVSSVINGKELNQTTSSSFPPPKTQTQHDSLPNVLLNEKLKNVCFLSVEQREIDVTAKPSVIDTSTSISDLEPISGCKNKFQICGTPKELNNEEYIALLEILYQEPNFVHLQELQNVCKKLALNHSKI